MRWYKRCKYVYHYHQFTFEYDTVEELAQMVVESGCNMENPYDPDTAEYELFNEERLKFRKRKCKPV